MVRDVNGDCSSLAYQVTQHVDGYKPCIVETRDEEWIRTHGGLSCLDLGDYSFEEWPSDWQLRLLTEGEKIFLRPAD